MVVEAVQNYVNLVNGLTRMTRERARATARVLLHQAGLEEVANGAGERVTKLAEEILVANRANRELVENLITAEVDKAAARWGFVRNDDVDALREEVAELRAALVKATAPAPAEPAGRSAPRGRRSPASTAAQGPPLGGAPDPAGVSPTHPELVPSEPLPYEPGPIQPNAARGPARKRAPGKRTPGTPSAAKRSAGAGTAAKRTAGAAPARKKAAGVGAATKKAPAAAKRTTSPRKTAESGPTPTPTAPPVVPTPAPVVPTPAPVVPSPVADGEPAE